MIVPGSGFICGEVHGWIPWFDPDHLDPDFADTPGVSVEWDDINQWWRCDDWVSGPGHFTAGWRFKNLGVLNGVATGFRAHVYAYPVPAGDSMEMVLYKDPVGPDLHSDVEVETDLGAGPTIEGVPTHEYFLISFPLLDSVEPPVDPNMVIENNDFLRIVSKGLYSPSMGGVCWVTSIEIYIP
jgi:hypothetical protein